MGVNMSATVEAPGFNQAAADLITRATAILPASAELSRLPFQQGFTDERTGVTGYAAFWLQGPRRELRISATTTESRGEPTDPYTRLQVVEADSIQGCRAKAYFRRRNFPGLEDVQTGGQLAIQHGKTVLDELMESVATGTLTFSSP